MTAEPNIILRYPKAESAEQARAGLLREIDRCIAEDLAAGVAYINWRGRLKYRTTR